MDYLEGWFEGDAARMDRALHPEFVKRCRGIEGDDPDALETLSAREMIDATDLLHLIDTPEGWRIVNAAWRLR
jgi:hypothetical protein